MSDLPSEGDLHPQVSPYVVAIESTVTTRTGKVAFIARHSDGRYLAMMAPQSQTTAEQMMAAAQAAFDSQHLGDVPG